MDHESETLQSIINFFVGSKDFNGIPLMALLGEFPLEKSELIDILTYLIRNGEISLNFDDNPHILRFPALPSEDQIARLSEADIRYICIYPTTSVLRKAVKPAKYRGRPFTRRLALGEPQLSYASFDLTTLEAYRNDPRYYYENDDISGFIGIRDETGGMLNRDQVLIESFGFSYDEHYNRAVAVFLRYLSNLSPEHQQIWNAKILHGDYKLHPDYFRSSIRGEFYEGVSIFDAFIGELHVINEMCKLMGRPPLFRQELTDAQKPREFCFLIRPTLREFNNFVLTLDKAISENISREFFQNDVPFTTEETRHDGKIVVTTKGTIKILEDWLKQKFRTPDQTPLDEMISTFKEVRKLRQQPAHATNEDAFDPIYFQRQRDLMTRAYTSIRSIRLIFTNHPKVREYEVPDWLQTGKIWTY